MLQVLEKVSDRMLAAVVPAQQVTASECCYVYSCWKTAECYGKYNIVRAEFQRLLCTDGYRGSWRVYHCGSCLGKKGCY